MNNVSVGNKHFQYYETIGGGGGAASEHRGCDATQVQRGDRLTIETPGGGGYGHKL